MELHVFGDCLMIFILYKILNLKNYFLKIYFITLTLFDFIDINTSKSINFYRMA